MLLLAQIVATARAQSITTLAGGGFDDGRPATSATLDFPQDAALDSAGNLFIADYLHNRVRRVSASTGFISTAAGSGSGGTFGDGGPAIAAGIYPSAIAVDRLGNLYIVSEHRIQKVSALTGVIETIAGATPAGYSGDGDLATAARLNGPERIAVDADGNLFIADTQNHVVRRIDAASGIIRTIVGTGTAGAGSSQLNLPAGLALGAGGALYIADTGNHRVLRTTTGGGALTVVAGTGSAGSSSEDVPATQAALNTPKAIALDSAGNLYIVETANHGVRVVNASTGRIRTIAGGSPGFRDGAAADARFEAPRGVTVDGAGNVFIVDTDNYRVRRYSPASNSVSTVAGNGARRLLGDGGPATSATLDNPRALAIDPLSGNLVVAERFGRVIRRITLGAGVPQISSVAGNTETGDGGDGGQATQARVTPGGIAFDRVGNLYITHVDSSNRIRMVDRSGVITAFAGTGTRGNSGDGGQASQATFNTPLGLAVDNAGFLYVADSGNHRVRRINLASRVIENFAGTGTAGFSGDNGAATQAQLSEPGAIAIDPTGNVYIADKENHRVRRVDTAGRITTVAGSGLLENGSVGYGGDGGQATAAKIGRPRGVAFDLAGALLIADAHNNRIRRVDLGTGIIETIAGKGGEGDSGDGGPATLASLSDPWGVITDDAGNLYIADSENNDVRAVLVCSSVGGPSLVSPRDNATSVALGPVLRWELVPRAFRYDVYLDTISTPARLIASDVSGSSYAVGNLSAATKYYWKVVAKGDPFCTPQSAFSSPVIAFTTIGGCSPPAAVALSTPENAASGVAAPVALSWQPAAGASSYEVFFGTSNPPPLAATTSANSHSVASLIPGTEYFWKVRARASCDSTLTAESPIRSFRAAGTCQAAGAFSTVAPNDGQTGIAQDVILQWSVAPNASAYDVYFGTANPPPLFAANVAATELKVSGLASNQKYFWRAIAKAPCGAGGGTSTAVVSFTTRQECAVPAAPALLAPPGKIAAGQTYVMVWREAANLERGGGYRIERSLSPAFATLLDAQEVTTTSASFIASTPGIFYHRVRAVPICDPAKAGPYSETKEASVVATAPNVIFTVQPRAVVVPVGTRLELQKAFFTLENLSTSPVQVLVSRTEIGSVPFFTVHDPLATDSPLILLPPREPRTFELRFAGPPSDQQGNYQGLVVVSVPGSAVIPYAFVNLKVGSGGSARPRFLVNGIESEYAFFPGAADDRSRAPISVEVENPGSAAMDIGFEIGPELWLSAETDWVSIPPRERRTVRLSTRRDRAQNGSPLPRYTYLTARTRSGETARLLVQDNDSSLTEAARSVSLGPRTHSLIIPEVVSGARVSRLRLSNVGSDAAQAELIFTPQGSDGFAAAVRRATVLVPPVNVINLTDPLTQLFGLAASSAGQVEVRASEEKIGYLTVSASVHSPNRPEETLWQVPTVWRLEGTVAGKPHRLTGVTATSDMQTALVFAETTGIEQTTVRAVLYDKNGLRLGDRVVSVPRYGLSVVDDVRTLSAGANVEAGRIEVSVESGGGSVVVLARGLPASGGSGLTLTSEPVDDPATVASSSPTAASAVTLTTVVVPVTVAGSLSTTSANSYQSILGLAAASNASSTFILTFLENNGAAIERSVTVDAGKTTEYKNVLRDLFGLSSAQGSIKIQVPAGARVYSGVSLVTPVGQPVSTGNAAVVQPGSAATTGGSTIGQRPLYLDGLEQSTDPARGTRWNLYLTEVGGGEGSVVVRLYEAGNRAAPIAEKAYTVQPFRQVALETVFSALELDTDERRKDRTNVLLVLTPKVGSSSMIAAAVSIDNRTGAARSHLLSPTGGVPATGSGPTRVTVVEPVAPPRRRPARSK